MKISLENKNTLLFVILLFLIFSIIAVSIYNFLTREEESPQDLFEEEVAVLGGYEIRETSDGIVIENKEGKFSLLAPMGWVAENYGEKVTLSSSPLNFIEDEDSLDNILDNTKNGDTCMFSIRITRYGEREEVEGTTKVMDLLQLIGAIEGGGMGDPYYNTVFVDNNMALEAGTKEGDEKYVFVEVPFEDKIYSFTSGITSSSECIEMFSQVLGQIRIGRE